MVAIRSSVKGSRTSQDVSNVNNSYLLNKCIVTCIQSQLSNAYVECKFEKVTSCYYIPKWLEMQKVTQCNYYVIVTVTHSDLTYRYRFKCNEAQMYTDSHYSISKQQRDSEWRRVYIRTVAPIVEDIVNKIREQIS